MINLRCINYRKTANHPSCKSTYTVTVSDQIQSLITKNEVTSAKRGRSVFHLSTYDDPALLNKDNYTLICRQCSPSFVCSKHAHIPFYESAFKKLKSFQEDEICLYTSHVSQNKMPKIKAKTLRREKMLMEHLNKFNNLKNRIKS